MITPNQILYPAFVVFFFLPLTVQAGPPAAPKALTGLAISSSQINLSWKDKSSNETAFEVQRATDTSFTQEVVDLPQAGKNIKNYATPSRGGQTFYFRVRAVNAQGKSAYSNVASVTPPSSSQNNASFDRVITIVFENTSVSEALSQPFFQQLKQQGAYLDQFAGVTHPSFPNYLAMIAGEFFNISDDNQHDIANADHVENLIEAHDLSWKEYLENYPGGTDAQPCFLGMKYPTKNSLYFRKHAPVISMLDVSTDANRCKAHVRNATDLDADLAAKTLPNYMFYTPNINNDGHNTDPATADQYLRTTFGPKLINPDFMNGTLVVVTFDEDDRSQQTNKIYTVLYGAGTIPGSVASDPNFNHYSILRMIEDRFGLGQVSPGNKNDSTAAVISGIWQ